MQQMVYSPVTLGNCLRRARKMKKLTQHEVGANFCIDQTTVSSIEQGAKGSRIETIFRLLAALNLELVVQDRDTCNSDNKLEW